MWFLPNHEITNKIMKNPWFCICPLTVPYIILVIPNIVDIFLILGSQMPTPEIVLEMDIFAADSDAIIDPEALPIKPQSFDAVLSHFILPFVNDVPGALIQWRQALVPDGVLLATDSSRVSVC